jgi:cold shock CspA family protein
VHCWLQQMPGGRLRGRDISLVPSAVPSDAATVENAITAASAQAQRDYEASGFFEGTGVLYHGAEINGTVRMYNPGQDGKGYGFINLANDPTDLYFQTKDLRQEDQEKVAQGFNLIGSEVWCWIEMLDNGRSGKWRAHDVSLSSDGGKRPANFVNFEVSFSDGMPPAKKARTFGPDASATTLFGEQRLKGTVKTFNNSFGFLSSPGVPEDVFFLKMELPVGCAGVSPGQEVEFDVIVQDTGKFRAKAITLSTAATASSPVSAAPDAALVPAVTSDTPETSQHQPENHSDPVKTQTAAIEVANVARTADQASETVAETTAS